MKRIVRFEVNVYDNGRKVDCCRFTRGVMIIRHLYDNLTFLKRFRHFLPFNEFLSMFQECHENGNVLIDDEYGWTLEVRRWSYHRKH